MLAYMFGALNQRIKVLESDLTKLESTNERVSDRIYTLSVMLTEVKTILSSLNDPANFCSMCNAPIASRKRKPRVVDSTLP